MIPKIGGNEVRVAKCVLMCLLIFTSTASRAAEFILKPQPVAKSWAIHFSGTIKSGDTEKLRLLIGSNPKKFLASGFIFLNSNGGSVQEALKLADLIETSGLAAGVPEEAVCASSCFLIYAAAPMRYHGLGKVLVHRPYYEMQGISASDYGVYAAAQRKATLDLRNFLESRSVPSNLIDKMMSLPSNAAYQITSADATRIGIMAPSIEEVVLAKCGFSNANILIGDFLQNLECAGNAAMLPLRVAYVQRALGREKTGELLRQLSAEQDQP